LRWAAEVAGRVPRRERRSTPATADPWANRRSFEQRLDQRGDRGAWRSSRGGCRGDLSTRRRFDRA